MGVLDEIIHLLRGAQDRRGRRGATEYSVRAASLSGRQERFSCAARLKNNGAACGIRRLRLVIVVAGHAKNDSRNWIPHAWIRIGWWNQCFTGACPDYDGGASGVFIPGSRSRHCITFSRGCCLPFLFYNCRYFWPSFKTKKKQRTLHSLRLVHH